MADTSARPISFLPSIKCSDCGVEIEISKMGDHVCGTQASAAPVPPPQAPRNKSTKSFFDKAASLTSSMRGSGGLLKSSRSAQQPPRIDTGAANKPFLGVDTSTPVASSNYSKSAASSDIRSKSPQQSYRPPSHELFTKDGGVQQEDFSPEEPRPLPSHNYPESNPLFAPRSPRPDGGNSVMERMNGLTSGPFDARPKSPFGARPKSPFDLRPKTPQAEPVEDEKSAHKRTTTLNSFKNHSRTRTSSRASNMTQERPGTQHSDKSRSSVRSNGPSGLPENPKKPGPPPRPARPGTVDTFLEKLQEEGNHATLAGVSSTFMVQRKESLGGARNPSVSLPRRPSESGPQHIPQKPSVPRVDTLPEPPQPAQENAKRFPRRTSSRSNISFKNDTQNAPPLPGPAAEFRLRNLSHAPSESASSEDSSGFDGRSNSGRSTPPTSAGSSPNKDSYVPQWDRPAHERKASRKVSSAGFDGRSDALRSLNSNSRTPTETHRKNSSVSRPANPQYVYEAFRPPPAMPAVGEPPESPMDPAIQRGLFNPYRPPEMTATEIQSVGDNSSNAPPMPPVPAEAPPLARPRDASVSSGKRPGTSNGQSKGSCRGCNEPIIGKSVKAADGRLTGRWHKQCFVCRTCASPFATADFYVHENHPYCAQHYHQLNGSLCRACNTGIEGAYLETERRQKFHPRCFNCRTCRMPLRDDYFEVGGIPYCERHAWHAARGPGPGGRGMGLGPPRQNPERRRTRLMMMAPMGPQY
ncbi:uncharacterized protein K452DRAFT_301903 [Aplosporella prunicola CBS 121167]|uniref:LIM zinc-binding domain-containing protein n=1 Tax=Aplosporella prunicola CBS 121167 TaxID=1176127 RepID=A0A6A6B2C2_9PEZI|nr:uncharacterized protein K452DRAFT_301903 [Aplosporella prunicola CBS 121167]KAF2137513.1 hypothetical protein K452DRAFT_301903 [Aplosporella prunicola CBS 121167]